jgi:hypothetical protein
LLLVAGAVRGATPGPGPADAFESRVRPVLVDQCLRCHGPSKQQGGLRLDSRAAALAGGDSGPAVVPGDPDTSLIIEAVRRDGLAMPPDRPLDPDSVAAMVDWVRQGAPWPPAEATAPPAPTVDPRGHWAFRPLADPAPPPVRDPAAARDPIDRFVLARLEAVGLSVAPEADRRTLIRRLSFDLLGLPPGADEVDAFVADRRPDAYERLVDRLLASPQLGVRWARHWLDVARYADTKGYVLFEEPGYPWAWTYRDYVVRAGNADVPYDRFVTEQLAADLLPDPDGRSLAALGFLTVGGRFMGNAHDVIDDRIDVTTRGLAGLTVACARCHDHKYDPISQAEYYGLHGVFASTEEPLVPPPVDPPPDTPEYREFARELDGRVAALDTFLREKYEALKATARARMAEYLLAAQATAGQPAVDAFMLIADGNDLNPVVLGRWRALLDRTRRAPGPVLAPWHELAAVPAGRFADAARALADRLRSDAGGVNPALAAALVADPPESLAELATLYADTLRRGEAVHEDWRRRMRLDGTPDRPDPRPDLAELAAFGAGPDAPANVPFLRSDALALLPDRASQARFNALRGAVEGFRATGPHAPPRAMALNDRAVPVAPRVLKRGNPATPGAVVPRGAPAVLVGTAAGAAGTEPPGSGRLELARTLTGPASHLSARVIVNRLWMHHMGAPLVATPADFGTRSEPPTHPELLDHLAASLLRDGWSLKALHRRIVLTATYRQASRPAAGEADDPDPENRLLGRANRRRLEFEALRDAMLAASGALDPALDGPPRPDAVATDNRRRTLYARIDRLNPAGVARSFDVPDPNALSPARAATVVAPQALFLMNHPFVRQAAAALLDDLPPGATTAQEPEPTDARLVAIHRRVFGRGPREAEREAARAFLGAEPTREDWRDYVQALFMSNEFAIVD